MSSTWGFNANFFSRTLFVITALSLLHTPHSVHAAVAINLWEDGASVRAQASGTLDISGLSFDESTTASLDAFVLVPNNSDLIFNNNGDLYFGITSTPSFGFGGTNILLNSSPANTITGDSFGFSGRSLLVPAGFNSGDSIFSEAVLLGTTLATLGADDGTYDVPLPNDSITLIVGQAPVPEPSAFALCVCVSLCGTAARRRR